MKKLVFPLAVALTLLIACGETSNQKGGSDSATGSTGSESNSSASTGSSSDSGASNPAQTPDSATRCYLYISGKDTVRMKVVQNGTTITGNLNFSLSEKDKNSGVINGSVVNDTLIADYTYQSEGVISTREEIMLRKGDGYLVGTGERQDKGGKMKFTDRKKLAFGTMNLGRVTCSQ